MPRTILITGSTDGIGFETAQRLVAQGHDVLLHGRSDTKLAGAARALVALGAPGRVETYLADLSDLAAVESLAAEVLEREDSLDVLINNAGVLRAPEVATPDGLDVRFAGNTIAPYLLTRRLLPLLGTTGRVVNLSSAAQAPVDLLALAGGVTMSHGEAYAQSKLALTAWSRHLALELGAAGPMIVAVNPGSLLATTMVKEGYGITGSDVGIGAGILVRAALADEFADASGSYYDNDSRAFAAPHPDALDPAITAAVVAAIEAVLARR
ncbi:SDR family NAD(P)-dependent oxidoreductase [Actinotalea sp.]|uniref:SDR family NAD(P)-dependent oxidoreductase n=1 Tax=Actinotalea sp. TaxID=1872145 RepID=UPI003561322C